MCSLHLWSACVNSPSARASCRTRPTVGISPDLPVCDDCLKELFDPDDPRYLYPYISCTSCGPRYSVVLALPYDRPNTTMKSWLLDDSCAAEYSNPRNRRFHAQPLACTACGPSYYLHPQRRPSDEAADGNENSIWRAAEMLRAGRILAVKGLGGYHLSCDARNPAAVAALRDRKYRKEKPFALIVRDLALAHTLVDLSSEAETLLSLLLAPLCWRQRGSNSVGSLLRSLLRTTNSE